MASIEEPEVQFAQRLACNEKSVRNKALKKLRKYISVRSHSHTGGFTAVELLKLWKGLFYCLWMQDKPLLQEELSRNISTLIHSFHQFDTQLLYLESFLQTVKREWTGIDRLRMDKFFQLVRFMFRQTFELLKRNSWEKGQISRFVDLLTAELLQVGSRAPSGLQLHVLDLYMSELAAVGSAELTADQNLVFIEPFCRTAAKTKDRTLFSAVCSRIFSVIIDQAPFAIQDLMKELEAAGSDSGQASEEEQDKEEKPAGKKKQHSISKSKEDIDDDDDDDDDDEMFDSEDPDSELQDDIGPVLQFDYSAVADKLFELASRNSTPGPNRQRLYKIIKVLRDLSEGIFPQDEYPEEVSTDEDDDMFATRKKLKRLKRKGLMDPDQDDSPAAKKTKKKKTVDKQNEDSEPADVDTSHETKKKKKKKKKKALVNSKKTENGCGGLERSQEAVLEEESSLAVKTSDPVTEESHPPQHVDQSQEDMVDPEKSSANDGPSPKKRKKKKKKVALKDEAEKASVCESTAAPPKDTHSNDGEKADTKVSVVNSQAGGAVEAPLEMDLQTPATKKKKKKGVKEAEVEKLDTEVSGLKVINDTTPVKKKEQEGARAQSEVHVNGVSSETDSRPKLTPITAKKKSKRKSVKAGNALSPPTGTDGLQKAEPEAESSEPPQKKEQQLPEVTMTTPQQDAAQISAKQMADSMEEPAVVLSSGKTAKKKKRKIPVVIEFEADELEAAALADHAEATTPKKTPLSKDPADQQTPATIQKKKKKKSQVPDSGSKKVTFGLKNNKTAEFKKTDRSLLLSPDGSSRVPFDPAQKPKCSVLKSPRTRLSTINQRNSLSIPNSTPKRQKRPAAADFF
ncbi:unnamed protein product [Ophioblennius macclurei]